MPRIFVCYGGRWKENKKEYEGGQLRGLVVDLGITYEDFLRQIYRISGINSDEFDLVIRCMYNIKPLVAAFVIRNEEDLHFFLTGEDVSQLALLVSTISKEVHGSMSNIQPYTPSFPTVFDNLSQYNMEMNAQSLTPLTENVVSYDLGEDREVLTYGESVTDADPVIDGDLTTDVDVDGITNVEHVTDGEPMVNGNPTTDVEHVTDGELITYGEALRTTCQRSNNPIVISGQCSTSDQDVEVGHLFLSKKELCMKLSVLAMKKKFEFRVKRSTTKLYIVKCVEESCRWRLRAIKNKGSNEFKISKYSNVHTCSRQMMNNDHRQARSWVVSNLIKSKYEDVGHTYKPKDIVQDIQHEYGVYISYERAWRAREGVLTLTGAREEALTSIPKTVGRVGRRRQSPRTPSTSETRQAHKCSRCGNMGHNRKTCPQLLTNNS